MAISTKRAYELAKDGRLTVDEVLKTLYESEGVQGCRLVLTAGHPLQHIEVLLYPVSFRKDKSSRMARAMLHTARGQAGLTPLEEKYWKRGPGNTGGIKYHSMFRTDEEAAEIICRALCSEGGVRALKYLSITDEITVVLATYLGAFYQTTRRQGSQQSQQVFTKTAEHTTLVVLVLHSRHGTLHIHTAFPTQVRRHDDTLNLSPQMVWELEVTDRVTGKQSLVRPNVAPGTGGW
jgi:hypothetical protein